jgi:hypothetical protein
MPSLRDPEFNLGWAKQHLEALNSKVGLFENAHKPEISTDDDLENQFYVIRVEMDFPVEHGFEIAVMAGDFVNRLRASLDHLAWQLALFGTSKPGTGVYFPIVDRDTEDAQIKIAKATFGWPDEAVSVVKSLQPYKAGDLYKTHHLWRLNKLWNIDKHRHLPAHGAVSESFIEIAGFRQTIPKEWFDGEDVMRIPLRLKDKVTLHPNAGIRFLFMDPNEGWELSMRDLAEMYNFVAGTAFPAFARFFK